jgi:putative PIN family toxin of toxin-antitoxin system
MTRVVLDTNVVVSSMLATTGNEARVLDLIFAGSLIACVTEEVLAEYASVLHRRKFRNLSHTAIDDVLKELSRGQLVRTDLSLTISPDPSDNRFLECAQAAYADFLVTGNKRHFPAAWKNTRIVNARELLEAIL